MLNLLPRQDPVVRAYVETLQDFGSQHVPAGRRRPGSRGRGARALRDAGPTIWRAGSPRCRSSSNVEHRIGDPRSCCDTFFPKAMLFLDAPGRASQLAARLSDDGIRQRVSRAPPAALDAAGDGRQGARQARSRWASPQIFLGRLESSRGTLNVDWTSGYYLSRDHRLLLILAEPVQAAAGHPVQRAAGHRASTARSRRALARLGRDRRAPRRPPQPGSTSAGRT